jgi:hypothetical protein
VLKKQNQEDMIQLGRETREERENKTWLLSPETTREKKLEK